MESEVFFGVDAGAGTLSKWEANRQIDDAVSEVQAMNEHESSSFFAETHAAALLQAPDVLLLDEPTNHLDIDAIRWLEEEIRARTRMCVLVVTHDRAFLNAAVDEILELHAAAIYRHRGDYASFLEAKQARLEAEGQAEAAARKAAADELAGIVAAEAAAAAKAAEEAAAAAAAEEAAAAKAAASASAGSLIGIAVSADAADGGWGDDDGGWNDDDGG